MPRKAANGTLDEAETLQTEHSVPDRFRGPWFHSSKDKRKELTEREEPTFLSRSPHGWTGWGGHKSADPVLVVYVTKPLASPDSVLRAPFVSGGDKDGFEGGKPLPDWWLIVQNEDVEKLMIVDTFTQDDQHAVETYAGSTEYQTFRTTAVERLRAKLK